MNATTTTTTRKSTKPRTLDFRATTQVGVYLVRIVNGKPGLKTTVDETYTVHHVPSDGGDGFLMVKANLDSPEAYHVLLDGLCTSCECMGFLRHQHCKHVDALQCLHRRGNI